MIFVDDADCGPVNDAKPAPGPDAGMPSAEYAGNEIGDGRAEFVPAPLRGTRECGDG